ncbi:MAG: hypothetical protein L3K16_06165 [Thermoplasmata archaeon]|nr:hypothetical protein [Thermoplasmata archaeon]
MDGEYPESDDPAVSNFDLTIVEASHFALTASRRRTALGIAIVYTGLFFTAAVFLILKALLDDGISSRNGIGEVLLAVLVVAVTVVLIRDLNRAPRRGPYQVAVSSEGVSFAGGNRRKRKIVWGEFLSPQRRLAPPRTIRLVDYRTTKAGQLFGTPCILGSPVQGVALSGPAFDAMLSSARSRALHVKAAPEPIADLAGRSLGTAVNWQIRRPR